MIDEQTLVLYYYDDGLTEKERRDVANALGNDPLLAARFDKLRSELEEIGDSDIAPAPSHLVQRWHDSIEDAARAELRETSRPQSPVHFWSFFWGAAVTAALALGIGIGAYFSGGGDTEPATASLYANDTGPSAAAVPASFTRGLEAHLQQSQWDIASMPVHTGSDRSRLAQQIIEQNRMFVYAADQNSAPGLARVLRAFEPILMRLAAEDISPEEADALRAQLSFELNVMLTKLARETSNETTTT
jgi:hypothetical protein